MRLGYFTMPLHPPGSDLSATLESDLVQMETLDRLGYCEAWIGEHFTTVWENIPPPTSLSPRHCPARRASSSAPALPACPTTTPS